MDGSAKEHDATIGQAIDSLLYPPGSPKPPTKQEAGQRSIALTTLPLGMGGAGVTRLEDKLGAAFISTTLRCSISDPIVSAERYLFRPQLDNAYAHVAARVHPQALRPGSALTALIPPSAAALATSDLRMLLSSKLHKRKLMAALMTQVH